MEGRFRPEGRSSTFRFLAISRIHGLLFIVAAVVGMAATTATLRIATASAHFAPGHYSHSTDACTQSTNRVDPVMDAFHEDATATKMRTHVEHHTLWTNQQGSPQVYKTHSNPTVCAENSTLSQRASACGSCDRYHIRFRQTYHSDATWGITSIGTPHQEDWITGQGCGITGGHAVVYPYGFQNGRTVIYNKMVAQGAHPFGGSATWGNTQSLKQCNDTWVSSLDGKVDFIMVL